MCRHYALVGTEAEISPTHWKYGAIARLSQGEKIDKLLYGKNSNIFLSYVGLNEVTKLMTGKTELEPEGHDFAIKIVKFLKEKTLKWKKELNITFSLSDPPSNYVCSKLIKLDKENYGTIKDITDKTYYTNSYHIDEKEEISPFDKLKFEGEFQNLSGEGTVSAIKIKTKKNIEDYIKYIYDNDLYVEFDINT